MFKNKKNELFIIFSILFILLLMLLFNFNIKKMDFGDDNFFLKQFTYDFHGNYVDFLKFRYDHWTSRLIIEAFLVQCVQKVTLWRIINAIAMTIIAVMPAYLLHLKNKMMGFALGTILSLSISISTLNNAGWIATTTNYVWVMAAALISVFPIINYMESDKISWMNYFISIVAIFYAANQEQMVIILFSILVFMGIMIKLKDKGNLILFLPHFIIIMTNLFVVITCKGNHLRNLQETKQWFPEFRNYSIFTKFELGYISTLRYLILNLSLFMSLFLLLIFMLGLIKNMPMTKKMISGIPFVIYEVVSLGHRMTSGKALAYYFNLQATNQIRLIFCLTFFVAMVALSIWCLCDSNKEFFIALFILFLGIISRVMIGFTPTVFVSGIRTFYFTYVMFIVCAIYLLKNTKYLSNKSLYRKEIYRIKYSLQDE